MARLPLPTSSNLGFSYLGWVSEPCSTNAVWDMHCERMLLRSWLTAGWLHIWKEKTNKITPDCWKLTIFRRDGTPENGMLCSSLIHTEQARVTVSPQSLLLLKSTVREERRRLEATTQESQTCAHSLCFAKVKSNKPQRPSRHMKLTGGQPD